MKKTFIYSTMLIVSLLTISSTYVTNTFFVKATLGTLTVSITPNGSIKNKARNSFGESAAGCFSGYTAAIENSVQDTMIFITFNGVSAKGTDCNTHNPISNVIKVGKYPISKSGKSVIGTRGGITIKIADKYYSSSLSEQPDGSFIQVTSITPYTGTDFYDPTESYKKRFLVKGNVTARLFNAMVKDDHTDSKNIQFSAIFAE